MYRMKNLSRILVTILITLFLFTSCVKKKVEKKVVDSIENFVDSIENTYNVDYKDPNNPLNIIGMKVEWYGRHNSISGEYYYNDYKITLQTTSGDYKYSDEDAELYYDKYAIVFAMAACICDSQLLDSIEENIRDYLKDNLFEVVCNVPLNDSYPQKVREVANKAYYDNIDDIMHTMHLADRGYGYKVYEGYKITRLFSECYIGRLYVRRGDDSILYIKNHIH